MIKKTLWITNLLYCILSGAATGQAPLQKLYLNPKSTAIISQSQIIDSIRFIPLQQEGFELSMYNNVQVTKDYFLIIDFPRKSILLYKKDGKFVKNIPYKKLGENLYPSYQEQSNQLVFFGSNKNYSLTAKDQIEISLDWNNPRNKKYFKKFTINLDDTTFALQKDVVNERDILGATPYEENAYWSGKITTSPLYKDSMDYELKIYRNNELIKGFFPYNHNNEARFLYAKENVALSKTQAPGTYLVTRPFCDTVYKMINDSIYPYYHLVLPLENTIPSSFLTAPFKNKTERENFMRNNGWMFKQFYVMYETSSFLYFGVSYVYNFETFVYDKQADITYKTGNIKPDASQYNLKLLSDFGAANSGNKFYKVVKAGDLIAFFDQYKQTLIPQELGNFLKAQPKNDAPLVVEFTLKN